MRPAGAGEQATPGGAHTALVLSPPLRAALVEEMQGLDRSLQRIVSSIARADWATVRTSAEEIRGSFIVEKRLTETQRQELDRALPPGFLEVDGRFHRLAAKLAAAANTQDADLVVFYAYKLNESCVACHTRFAGARFPGFNGEDGAPAHR